METRGSINSVNEVEETRLSTAAAPEYQYHLKDHLGNVRTTFTSVTTVDQNTATLESASLNAEQSQFLRITTAKRVSAAIFDHTNGASTGFSERLNGSANEKYGVAKSISVMPGDVIQAEVYGKYVDQNTANWTGALTTLMNQIAANTAGVVYDGASYSSSTSSFPFAGLLSTAGSTGGPKAYLNWLIFDRNYNLITGGYQRMSAAPKEQGQDVAHELMSSPTINITQAGYVYIYLSNEETTPVEVYFDDLKVTHTKSPVVQVDEYYPFGLTFNSYQRENSTPNKFKFQGQEHIDDLNLGWDSFKWRNHQPDIGRFFNVDPLAEGFYYNSPYAFAENKVTSNFELEGLEAVSIHLRAFHPSKTFGGGFSGDDRGFSNSTSSTARVKTNVNIDFNQSSPQVTGGIQSSDPSHHPVLGTDTAPERNALGNVNIGETSTGAKMVSFTAGLEGANPLTPSFATPNIDVDGAYSISSNQETGILSISANVTGDKFPSAESFITDAAGNSVYIGVSAFQGSPLDLKGEGGKAMINTDLQIKFDSNGNFQNVMYQGQQYKLEDYNKMFQNQNPSGN